MKIRFIMRLYKSNWRIWDRQQKNWRGPPARTDDEIFNLKARLNALNNPKRKGKR